MAIPSLLLLLCLTVAPAHASTTTTTSSPVASRHRGRHDAGWFGGGGGKTAFVAASSSSRSTSTSSSSSSSSLSPRKSTRVSRGHIINGGVVVVDDVIGSRGSARGPAAMIGTTPPPSAKSRRSESSPSLYASSSKDDDGGGESSSTSLEIRQEQIELRHEDEDDGQGNRKIVSMRVASCCNAEKKDKPVLLFLHGSFHGAWCWTEKFFPYFVEGGYDVVAINWRGTGGTYAGDGVRKVRIDQHVRDLRAVVERLPEITGRDGDRIRPVVICHSFGGVALMKYLEEYPEMTSELSGIVAMCSVPPSGNGKMTLRFLRRSLADSYKITVGLAMKRCTRDARLCRQLFFGGEKVVSVVPAADGETGETRTVVLEDYGVSDDDIERYRGYFERDSEATIDIMDLTKRLPSKASVDGVAPFVDSLPPCMVLGGGDDFIVDEEALMETAAYFGLERPTVVDSPHDVMLGGRWKNAAAALKQFLVERVEKK